ncbi:MAG TPA: hybrid sensor histidine kinase/response regulator [Desulfatiglandales bacterium]|nr:hybrid sensor histidine kinase/response regulator [Desulfatiglandales bacterium]
MYDYKKYAVLYVDDEEKSLKYFHKAFQKDFRVLTASSAGEAEEILKQDSSGVGIVITDQRMPGQTGVDLLGQVRRSWPNIVRMLTTAYSDLDSAIEAVNSGAIFKYIVKPWNIRDLRGCLLRGMEFFLVQAERDTLLREKMSVLQRLVISDRIRSLAVLAMGLSHRIRNPMTALKTFLDLAPRKLLEELPESVKQLKSPGFWGDFWVVAQQEGERIMQIIDSVSEAVLEPGGNFEDICRLDDLVREGAEHIKEKIEVSGGSVYIDIDQNLSCFKADEIMLRRLFSILLRSMVVLNPRGISVTFRAEETTPIWGAAGARILITGDGPEWTEARVAMLFTPFSLAEEKPRDSRLDLLPAFFIVHHHGGDILVHKSPPDGPGFEIFLPFDPEATKRPSLEQDCLKKIMTHFEMWDSLRGDF